MRARQIRTTGESLWRAWSTFATTPRRGCRCGFATDAEHRMTILLGADGPLKAATAATASIPSMSCRASPRQEKGAVSRPGARDQRRHADASAAPAARSGGRQREHAACHWR